MSCRVCGSTETDYDPAKGDTVCVNCGTVIEENTIVSEVQFAEDANGASSVVGQFISASGTGMMSSSFAKESREITISNGRRKISHIAGALSLNSHHVEAAQRFFLLAVQHNFIQGRRTQHVVAACLYIVCRREKTPHMLIDFSDVLQTNVFALGSTFLKFTRLLNLQLPLIDPSLYIHRFASRLELGDKMHVVSMLALRLVQRMKRDWIQTGRRPSGICGAALLVAARVHGFRRTQRELVHVVRICDVTLRKRLCEFEETACGALTAHELGTVDLEALQEADPPAFARARRLEAATDA
ncbi:cyclin-like protein, partial [Pavlovales sp. CCMP2436]